MTTFDTTSDNRSSGPVPVELANDFELIVQGLTGMLAPFGQRVRILGSHDQRSGDDPAVVLLDAYGQHQLGIERLRSLSASPSVSGAVLFTTHLEPAQVDRVLDAGAAAVVSKAAEAEQLVATIEAVAAGRRGVVVSSRRRRRVAGPWPGSELGLSERESEIAVFLCNGLGNRGIAEAMLLSENTVKSHLKSVFHKIEASTRSQAVARLVTNPSFRHVGAAGSTGNGGVADGAVATVGA